MRAFKGLKARGGSDLGEKIKSNCELGAKWELFMIGSKWPFQLTVSYCDPSTKILGFPKAGTKKDQ